MRILTSNYWRKKFTKSILDKNGKPKIVRDGKAFENLVKRILDLEYGPNRWKETNESWDGSRDFEWRTSRSYKWAECKNYADKISLNIFSNTLVMAIIDFADEILIFSYSNLKRPVLDKLMQYADISQKRIKIYADESLEEIIFSHFSELKPEFFPTANFAETDLECLMPYISCQIISDPIMAYTMSGDLGSIEKSPSDINFDTTLCLNVYACNRSSRKISLRLTTKWVPGEFAVLNPNGKTDKNFILDANAVSVSKIYFKVLKYNPLLHFPSVTVACDTGERSFRFGTVKCSWIGDCILQGSSYKKIKKDFRNNIIKGKFFRGINLYGSSGVGKSRLLEECENLALGHGFRVIRFRTNLREKKNCSMKNVITEFICGLFDIPDFETFLMKAKEDQLSGIYQLLYSIRQKDSIELEYIEKTILPVVIQKLIKTQCYISIDNIQYYPTLFIAFLHLIIEKLLIENGHCKSRIGITFNMDYVHQQEECVSLWKFLCDNEHNIIKKEITGFATAGETRLFLNQLLQNSDIDPEQAQAIVDASNNNPFYVQSFLKLLEAENIIILQRDGYVIPPAMTETFKQKMMCIPDGVAGLLANRWDYYLADHDEAQSLTVLAMVHIFQRLTDELCKKFCLPVEVLHDLCSFHFLIKRQENEPVYVFEHDMTEMFFAQKYILLCKYAFHHSNMPQDIEHEWYNTLYHIIKGTKDNSFLDSCLTGKEPPYKIGYEIYSLWVFQTIQKIASIEELEKHLQRMTKVCETVREIYGTDAAITIYKRIIDSVKKRLDIYQANENWAWIMISYCNLLYESNFFTEAVAEIKNLLRYWPKDNITSENVTIYAYFYNRLHVYNRALHKCVTDEVINWLEKAEELQYCSGASREKTDEIKFLNLIDRGYCNYGDITSKNAVLEAWGNACILYENGNMPSKKMNYFYSKIRISLFQHDLTTAGDFIKKGIKAIDMKEQGTYYFLYFKQRYLLCRAACFLMDKYFQPQEIEDIFEQIEDYNCIIKSRLTCYLQWMKSIYYFYQGKYEDAFMCIQSAQYSLYESRKKTFLHIYINQLYDNACYFLARGRAENHACNYIEQLSDSKLISLLNKIMRMSMHELKQYLNKHQATSILQKKECKINFPIL